MARTWAIEAVCETIVGLPCDTLPPEPAPLPLGFRVMANPGLANGGDHAGVSVLALPYAPRRNGAGPEGRETPATSSPSRPPAVPLVDQRSRDRLPVVSLAEVDHRHTVGRRPGVDAAYVGVADPAARRRRWDEVTSALMHQEVAHLPDRLQLRHPRLQSSGRPSGTPTSRARQVGGVFGAHDNLQVSATRR